MIETTIDAHEILAAAEKVAGAEKVLKAASRKALRAAARPVARVVVKEGSESMPHRGGLAERLAGSSVGIRPTADWAGMRIILGASKHNQLGRIDAGRLRHPVFGNRGVWVDQTVPAGTYTDAINQHLDELKIAQLAAMQETIDRM